MSNKTFELVLRVLSYIISALLGGGVTAACLM